MKRSFAEYGQPAPSGPPAKIPNTGSSYAIKFLFSEAEMRAIVLNGAEIQQMSGATLSTTGELYPATAFQELNISGPDGEAVLSAAIYTLTHIVQTEGALTSGEGSVPDGECRLRTIVPTKAAAGIIGKGGSNIAQIRAATQLYVHVDKTALPPDGGLLSEQIVSLSGSLSGLQNGLAMVLDHVHNMVGEHWFAAWALSSNVGMEFPGIALDLTGKGMRGGKGEWGGKGDGGGGSPFGGAGGGKGASGEACQHFARTGWCKFGDACFHSHVGGPAGGKGGGAAAAGAGGFSGGGFSGGDDASAQAILQALGLGMPGVKGFSDGPMQGAAAAYAAAASGASGGSSGTICKFFASGNCSFGESCRNLHVPGAVAGKATPSGEACMHFQRTGR